MTLFNRAFVHGDVRDVMEMARTVLQAHAMVDWSATMLESLLAFCFPSTVTVTLVNGVVRSYFLSLFCNTSLIFYRTKDSMGLVPCRCQH